MPVKNPEQTSATVVDDAYQVMSEMLSGRKTTPEIVAFLEAHPETKLSPAQLTEFLTAIRHTAEVTLDADQYDKPLVDIAGTGGDQLKTVNISTLASLVAAASDEVVVCKYGNRSASGVCGSMDVLEAVGVDITTLPTTDEPAQSKFIPLFARLVYPGARHVAEARQAYGKPSLFNLLFPLARPIKGQFSFVMGFAHPEKMPLASELIKDEPVSALLVNGLDGSDEISVTGEGITKYSLIHDGQVSEGVLDLPALLGIEPIELESLQIKDKTEAVELFQKALDPAAESTQLDAIRLSVAANAAAVLAIAKLSEFDSLEAAYTHFFPLAQSILAQGDAYQLLNDLKQEP